MPCAVQQRVAWRPPRRVKVYFVGRLRRIKNIANSYGSICSRLPHIQPAVRILDFGVKCRTLMLYRISIQRLRTKTMQAVEFQAKIKNGTIEIPSQYKDKLRDVVRVIILTDEREPTANLIDQLLASPLKIRSFTPLSRAEI